MTKKKLGDISEKSPINREFQGSGLQKWFFSLLIGLIFLILSNKVSSHFVIFLFSTVGINISDGLSTIMNTVVFILILRLIIH